MRPRPRGGRAGAGGAGIFLKKPKKHGVLSIETHNIGSADSPYDNPGVASGAAGEW